MTQYKKLNIKLSNKQLNKINDDDKQSVWRWCSSFNTINNKTKKNLIRLLINYKTAYTKLRNAQHLKQISWDILSKLAGNNMKIAILPKRASLPLELTAAASAAETRS